LDVSVTPRQGITLSDLSHVQSALFTKLFRTISFISWGMHFSWPCMPSILCFIHVISCSSDAFVVASTKSRASACVNLTVDTARAAPRNRFLQAHRETEAYFALTGVSAQPHQGQVPLHARSRCIRGGKSLWERGATRRRNWKRKWWRRCWWMWCGGEEGVTRETEALELSWTLAWDAAREGEGWRWREGGCVQETGPEAA